MQPGELPEGWGLLAVRRGKLVCASEAVQRRQPSRLAPPPEGSPARSASLLRARRAAGRARGGPGVRPRRSTPRRRDEIAGLKATITELRAESRPSARVSVRLDSWVGSRTIRRSAPRLVLNGETEPQTSEWIERLAGQARRIAEQADDVLAETTG